MKYQDKVELKVLHLSVYTQQKVMAALELTQIQTKFLFLFP